MIKQLIKHCNSDNLNQFLRLKELPNYSPDPEEMELYNKQQRKRFTDLVVEGEAYFVKDGVREDFIVVKCKSTKELTSRSSKKIQYEISKTLLKQKDADGGIFVFFDDSGNFRFSFVRTNYLGSKRDFSSYKRYTYFVDPVETNTTFINRMNEGKYQSIESILEAFSVEPLNEAFYKEINEAFYSLVGGTTGSGRGQQRHTAKLHLPAMQELDHTRVRQFAVRLIGRTMFCWFLRHKSSDAGKTLIPRDWLSKEAVVDNPNYYHGLLEKLFFEVLNKKSSDRIKHLPGNHEAIPFLNGGLFEPVATDGDSDFYKYGKLTEGSYNASLVIPDEWFEALFEILERYNFTIDENSIHDAEVSIDPEMLGRIFENLLAEIDPNVAESERNTIRKATGSFYTPREIVDYMCESSLTQHLHNKTGISKGRLSSLYDHTSDKLDFTLEETQILVDEFDEVKIFDPAAGSGAFPMGILHKMITALEKLDPEAELWKAKQIDRVERSDQDPLLKSQAVDTLQNSNASYRRKLGVIQNSIYGSDIQPIAAEISRLRCFLSLIVDETVNDKKPNRGIVALPNLEFKFVTCNTLLALPQDIGGITNLDSKTKLAELTRIRRNYLQSHGERKQKLKTDFKSIQLEVFQAESKVGFAGDAQSLAIASWNPWKNEAVEWFDPKWMFGVDQFDIIIGNPPYGGTKISNSLKSELDITSKDPYGAFIARYLHTTNRPTCLKHQGLLSYIVSDTFMTIKSHKRLRELMLYNKVHSMIRVHPDTFHATVNTAIILCERVQVPQGRQVVQESQLTMADLTNTSIHKEHDRFVQLLTKTVNLEPHKYEGESKVENDILYMHGEEWTSESSPEYAIYTYPQTLIPTNSNKPFFVASPKLYGLMNDTTAPKTSFDVQGVQVQGRTTELNGTDVQLVKLGDIAEVKQGLATGDNHAYLFQNPESRGAYRSIEEYKEHLLTETDLEKIRNNESLRLDVIENGISKTDKRNPRYFEGRYIVPYDKGGESDASGGWMPNYYVPTNYFIDWSEWAVHRMKTYTIADRIVDRKESKAIKEHYKTTCCAVIRSPSTYFKESISFSRTGVYCPTFRLGSSGPFDTEGSMIFQNILKQECLISLLTSRLSRYQLKNHLGHTVHTQIDELKDLQITGAVPSIDLSTLISYQTEDQLYDYASNEQLEIDAATYKSYSLDEQDILEVENWYARRYSKLVAAQKKNLRDLGKSDNYLTLYQDVYDNMEV